MRTASAIVVFPEALRPVIQIANRVDHNEAACDSIDRIRIAKNRLVSLNLYFADFIQVETDGSHFLKAMDIHLVQQFHNAHAGSLRRVLDKIRLINLQGSR